eukprot:TRINITY_DN47458_c0_g1_i1.p1 TRINITY_DN47458_c0_g1~~TRINITY_DN47458_c0_g1_i1.p1  ORF type:complete len:274 (-),score=35.40 TRINITY_DN47458_c0_g1_i1:379-1200(-)
MASAGLGTLPDAGRAVAEVLSEKSKVGRLSDGVFADLETLDHFLCHLHATAMPVEERCVKNVVTTATDAKELVDKWYSKPILTKLFRRHRSLWFRDGNIVKLEGYRSKFKRMRESIELCMQELADSARHKSTEAEDGGQVECKHTARSDTSTVAPMQNGEDHAQERLSRIWNMSAASLSSSCASATSAFGLSDQQFESLMHRLEARDQMIASVGGSRISAVDSDFGFSDRQLESLLAKTQARALARCTSSPSMRGSDRESTSHCSLELVAREY